MRSRPDSSRAARVAGLSTSAFLRAFRGSVGQSSRGASRAPRRCSGALTFPWRKWRTPQVSVQPFGFRRFSAGCKAVTPFSSGRKWECWPVEARLALLSGYVSGDYERHRAMQDYMLGVAKLLERDPRREAILANRKQQLGILFDCARKLGVELAFHQGIDLGRGKGLGIGMYLVERTAVGRRCALKSEVHRL